MLLLDNVGTILPFALNRSSGISATQQSGWSRYDPKPQGYHLTLTMINALKGHAQV